MDIRRLIVGRNSVFLFLLLCPFLAPAFQPNPLRAQEEYYIPQQRRMIERGDFQAGLRFRYGTSGSNRDDIEVIPRLSYSPLNNLQLSAEIPYVYTRQLINSVGRSTEDSTKTGFGDVVVELRYTLTGAEDWRLIGSFESVFASGDKPFEDEVTIGDAFDRYTPGVTYLYVKDPVVSYFYVGYEFPQDETLNIPANLAAPQTLRELLRLILIGSPIPTSGRVNWQPGEAIRLRGGTSLLLNPTTRFNLFSSITIRDETEIDGQPQSGSQTRDVLLGTGMNFDVGPRTKFNLNLIFGVSDGVDPLTIDSGISYNF